jgi:outer membrane lipoprotein LolB
VAPAWRWPCWLAARRRHTHSDRPTLTGRLALRVEATGPEPARGFSADFDLSGDADHGSLHLAGPLGATLAEVRWQPGRAELTDVQGRRDYADLDALSQALFGETLPLVALVDWLRGRPWPGAPATRRHDGFEQLGWRIGLDAWAEGHVRASRDSAPAVSLRATLDRPGNTGAK